MCTCDTPALPLQLIKAFLQNSLAGSHLLLDGFLLTGQAACTQYRKLSWVHWNKIHFIFPHCESIFWSHLLVCWHSLVRVGHCLGVGWGDHKADSRRAELMSSCILHIPSGAIVPEQSVPLPTRDLPLYMCNGFTLTSFRWTQAQSWHTKHGALFWTWLTGSSKRLLSKHNFERLQFHFKNDVFASTLKERRGLNYSITSKAETNTQRALLCLNWASLQAF